MRFHNLHRMRRTKRALALSALALMIIYVLAYVEGNYPSFRVTRSTLTNTTTKIRCTSEQLRSSKTTVASAQVEWVPQWQRQGRRFARSFWKKSNDNSNNVPSQSPHWWCTQDKYDKSCRDENHMLCSPKGLLYVKVPKTGSTTISKVAKRLVEAVAQRSNLPDKCQHKEDHVVGAGLWYANRDPRQSFLVTSLRDPADRTMSRFFWSYVTRKSTNNIDNDNNSTTEVTADDEFILNYINSSNSVASGCTSKGQGGYQLNYISMSHIPEYSAWRPQTPTQVPNQNRVEELVAQAMLDYDFMILNERMEESLVILQFLLGLQTGDIVSLSYNVGGSYRYEHGKCKQLIKSHVSDGMKEYFQSEEWHAKNYGDYVLFAAVNRSIDLTIDQIGRLTFDSALQEFRRLEAKVNKICNENVPFPCSPNGTVLFHAEQPIPHDKISQCIDEVVRQERTFLMEGE